MANPSLHIITLRRHSDPETMERRDQPAQHIPLPSTIHQLVPAAPGKRYCASFRPRRRHESRHSTPVHRPSHNIRSQICARQPGSVSAHLQHLCARNKRPIRPQRTVAHRPDGTIDSSPRAIAIDIRRRRSTTRARSLFVPETFGSMHEVGI